MNVKDFVKGKRNLSIAAGVVAILVIAVIGFSMKDEDELSVIDFELVDLEAAESGALSAPVKPYVGPVNIDGTTFRLASFNNVALPQDRDYTLSFDGGLMSAKFCNTMGGDFLLDSGVIVSNLISTKMLCQEPADLMAMETAFGSILRSGASFYVEGNTLTIRGSNGEKFAFEAVLE